jgi:predicted homoserine dehydrogenase-like protein
MIYEIDNDDYEAAFPQEQEYVDWINHMETALATGKLVVTDRINIVLHQNNTEEYSPYSTVNS